MVAQSPPYLLVKSLLIASAYLLQGIVAECSVDKSTASSSLFSDDDQRKLDACIAGLAAVEAQGGDKQMEEVMRQRIASLKKSHYRSLNPGNVFFICHFLVRVALSWRIDIC